ncbi:MAG: [FeFe] hydrogenase H-cluster radical SAM maturase HydE [Candidatus Aureabacteria bacterium]|nr:[FeFe] hydrogenase H-cluster radical SAM maturase HydE [Candidatus Auribacterota bacterium]
MNKKEMLYWLNENDLTKCKKLFERAYEIKINAVGKTVYFRGIIELSNICQKNCYYCGVRRDSEINRYSLLQTEILDSAEFAYKKGYASIVIQAGEQTSEKYTAFISDTIKKIKDLSKGELGITLSLGEQTKDVYKKWFSAGAHRYLLRIETSSKDLYKKLHPQDHLFKERVICLYDLKDIGYQVGTGVMIGLPYQKNSDLAEDLLFFKKNDIDMIGMGPYIFCEKTPLSKFKIDLNNNFYLSLKMIALTRIIMPDINIAATTALQAIDPVGREKALQVGANIIMPNITPKKYRVDYQLYNNKPCLSEEAFMCQECLETRVKVIGENIGYNKWGDSIHFYKRIKCK